MNFRHVLPAASLAAALVVPTFAQTAADDENSRIDFDNPGLPVYTPKNKVTFGFRALSSGAAVNFGNLGSIPMRPNTPAADGSGRVYDNGVVATDSLRTDLVRGEIQRDANGNPVRDSQGNFIQTSTPGGRYQTTTTTNGNTVVNGDYLSYTPGQTRSWSYATDAQLVGNHVALSNYGAVSQGATAMKEQSFSGGVEMELSREIGKLGRRVEWSLSAGLAINDINAKTGGTVTSTLRKQTDYFQFIGAPAPSGTRAGPTFGELRDSNGNLINSFGLETTAPLRDSPTAGMSTDTTTVGGASVQGNWQIKGAYAMIRLGPTLRTQLGQSFGLSASVGVAGAYAGSRYSVVESMEMPDLSEPVTTIEDSTASKFLTGYYADLTLDWVANERTGLFAGVTMQQFGDYDQSVGGRTAKIDLGNSVGLRGGITVKF